MERLATLTWWLLVLVIAVSSTGMMQWIKGLWQEWPKWAQALALPLICMGLAATWQPWPWWTAAGLLALAVAQLGYDTLIKGLLAWVARLNGPQVGPPAATGPPA